MDLLRRIFGRTDEHAAPVDDGISVTHGGTEVMAAPPEPVIDTPEPNPGVAVSAPAKSGQASPESGAATKPLPDSEAVTALGTRPLPSLEAVVPQPGQRLRFGQRSDVGMVRGNNQDSMLTLLLSGTSVDDLPDLGVFIVADGMGGHQEGERASAITVRIMAKHVTNEIVNPMLDERMNDPDRPSLSDVLRAAVRRANEAVSQQIPEGGTTVTAAVVVGELAYIAHVGDSRAYLITSDGIEQITRDHSLVQRLIELDQLTPEEAAEHPQRNVLYRAIGQSETLDIDVVTRRLPPAARLMLCSDGLWNMVPEAVVFETIRKHDDPQIPCNELVRMANDRGGPDNVTVVIVQAPGSEG